MFVRNIKRISVTPGSYILLFIITVILFRTL